jgi:peptidoglycan/LPS O-acetylase OafA/YrhL
MQQTIGGHHHTHYPIGQAVWIVAGIVVLLAFGDALLLLVLTFAVVTMITAWWTHRKVEHPVDGTDSELASVTPMRPALIGQHSPKKASGHASWRGPSAA